MLIIDAHAHVYSGDYVRYPTIEKPIRPPGESGSVTTLEALARENHVAGVCAVQPLSFYGWDNRFLCAIAKPRQAHMAAICALDADDADSPALLIQLVTEHGVRGLRSYPPPNGHLDHPGVEALWETAQQLGIAVDVFVSSDKSGELATMLARFPRLPVVIDHCLISQPEAKLANAVADMMRLAKYPNAYAKLSFLPLGSAREYPYRDMHEPCKRIIAEYGPERCVWGNAFPCELWSPKSSYAQNLRLFTSELGLGDAAKACILGQTANRLWFKGRLQAQ